MPVSLGSYLAPFGQIDVYLFDQLLKGRVGPEARVLDAGCGGGRNLELLLRHGVDVYGVDRDAAALARARALAAEVAPATLVALPAAERFQVAEIGALPYAGAAFDFVICNALLHFAPDEVVFDAWVDDLWRVLRRGGTLFARLASDIGLEDGVRRLAGRWSKLPDGTERFLVDEALLLATGERLRATLLDPIKTTNVQSLRCMTTWVLRKDA